MDKAINKRLSSLGVSDNELIEDENECLPVLAPMSAIAGNMATLMGSYYLASFNQGKGMQLGKVLGKQYCKVVIIGD